jgi:hypothetical protein
VNLPGWDAEIAKVEPLAADKCAVEEKYSICCEAYGLSRVVPTSKGLTEN